MLRGRFIASRIRSLLALLVLVAPAAYAAKAENEPIVVKDPQYGEVLFYFYQEDYFPAIVRLLAAQERQKLDDHAADAADAADAAGAASSSSHESGAAAPCINAASSSSSSSSP